MSSDRLSLAGLPFELFSIIVGLLDLETYIRLAIAHYHLFQRRERAPRMTEARLGYITGHRLTANYYPLMLLPTELMLQMLQRLPRRDVLHYIIANYTQLIHLGIAPRITEADVEYLRLAI